MQRKIILIATICLLGTASAFSASKMQPGLWKWTMSVDMGEAMPKISPQVAAALKARGLTMPDIGAPTTMQMCITPEQAAMDQPPMTQQQMMQQTGCTAQNIQKTANSTSVDMVCTGTRMQGKGHSEFSYTDSTHVKGLSTFTGTGTGGRPMNIKTVFSADFVSSNCGSVKPLQIPARPK